MYNFTSEFYEGIIARSSCVAIAVIATSFDGDSKTHELLRRTHIVYSNPA